MMIKRYIDFICDLLAIEDVSVINSSTIAIAKSFPEERLILVNDKVEGMELYSVLAHELRHQYQYDQTKEKHSDYPKHELEAIKKEFSGYAGMNEDGYLDQFVELDAFAFSLFIMRKVFKVETFYSEELPFEKVNAMAKAMENDFLDEEINDSLIYSRFVKSL